ncbi:MAG: prepilin-type N-terminal cleavage/methylation domain-containing protein [bacterium]|nr:prepilin-type N-terminal cleavage/methylation domain-containing protein [bacterium]
MLCKMKEYRHAQQTDGFTFLEVLVALSVISISIVALLNSHTLSLRQYLKSQILSRATMLAEEKINEIEAKGLPEIDDLEAEEYENGLRYVLTEGEFYDEEDTDRLQPLWRADYWWTTTIEDTEFDGVRKVTVEVFSKRLARESVDVDPWDEVQISPSVRLVTYIAATNRREEARSGVSPSTTTGSRQRS